MRFSRRDFVKTSVLGAVAAGVGTRAQGEDSKQAAAAQEQVAKESQDNPDRSSAPSSSAPTTATPISTTHFAFLKSGGDTLDAAIRVVKGPENDPNDD